MRRALAEDGFGGSRGTAGSSFAATAGYRHGLARVFARADAGDPLDPAAPWATVLWIMLNPSTADERDDDPTIRRVVAFSHRPDLAAALQRVPGRPLPGTTAAAAAPEVERVGVVNLYAIRATDPADLRRVLRAGAGAAAAIGQDTDARIAAWVRGASLVIAAWGAHAEPGRALDVLGLVGRVRPDLPVYRLGPVTASGMPRHPLYLRSDTPLEIHRAAAGPGRSQEVPP